MGNDAVVSPSSPNRQTRISQISEKIGTIAEVAVLPKKQQSIQWINTLDELTVKDVESQSAARAPTFTERLTLYSQNIHFPLFMIGVSVIEVILKYAVGDRLLMMIYGYDPHRRHELWRFITIMLAHSGHIHVWTNAVVQTIVGVLLEIVHGWKRIAIIYLSSILGGSLFITLMSPNSYVVGSSAGVYGLLFSHLATIIINFNEMYKKYCRLFWLLLYIIFDIGIPLYFEFVAKLSLNTSYAGHLGGAITGFLVSIFVLKNFEKRPWKERMQKICIGIIVALCCIILLVNVTARDYYPATEWNFDYSRSYAKYFLNVNVENSEDLEIRKTCEEGSECQEMLEQYKFNVTINYSEYDDFV